MRIRIPQMEAQAHLTPEVELRIQAHGPCTIKGEETAVAQAHGFGSVDASEPYRWTLHGPSVLRVPRWARVRIEIVNGPSQIQGLSQGHVHVETANGPFKVQELARLTANRISGPVVLERVTDSVTIEAVRGPLLVRQGPRSLNAQVRGPVRISLDAPLGRRLTLRVRGPVVIQVPQNTLLHGRIQATKGVQVDLDAQPTHAEAPGTGTVTIATWQASDPERALHLDIEARGRVYIGPNPPETGADVAAWTDLGLGFARFMEGLARWFPSVSTSVSKRVKKPRKTRRPSTSSEDLQEARKRILRMVAEGKISAEQAAKLLDALED